jgi:TusA-related sulfurtransferase
MPEVIPKSSVSLEDLGFPDGAAVLLRRGIAPLRAGELLEVRAEAEGIADAIQLWCRQEGHRYHAEGSRGELHRIERGPVSRPLAQTPKSAAEEAEACWGLSPRGAQVEMGGPEFSFPLRRKRDIWGEELQTIYDKAVNSQWSAARDIPWKNLPKHSPELEGAVCQVMTFLTENELAALYVPARFLARIHPHYREVTSALAIQIADEARHVEVFTRRAEEGGLGLGTTAASSQLSLQTLVEEPDFSIAFFLLSVMGEGTFLALLHFLQEFSPDSVTAELLRLAHRDESRHVAFGMAHLKYMLAVDPDRRAALSAAVERRSQMLASVSGLSPYVHDALVVYSGGGVSPAEVRRGSSRVSGLHREMDRSRRDRLQALGFLTPEAESLSSYHTKNFM